MIVHFILTILLVLTLTSDATVLCGNDAFSILVLFTKKRKSGFSNKLFVFQKICSKVKILKMFKISNDFHIRACRYLKRRAVFGVPSTVFLDGLMFFLLVLGWSLWERAFSSVGARAGPNFAAWLAEGDGRSFSLSIWWVPCFGRLYSLLLGDGCLGSLCGGVGGGGWPGGYSCTGLGGGSFSLWVSLNRSAAREANRTYVYN